MALSIRAEREEVGAGKVEQAWAKDVALRFVRIAQADVERGAESPEPRHHEAEKVWRNSGQQKKRLLPSSLPDEEEEGAEKMLSHVQCARDWMAMVFRTIPI
jgi:hypothetical protein